MAIDIRRLIEADAGVLDRVAPEVFDNPVDPRFLDAFLRDPRHILFVAVEDGMVVGMATGFEYFHPDKPPQLFINEVGVSPAFQRRGIGRQLTAALIEAARDRGCIYSWLGTDTGNLAGQACFGSVPEGEAPQPFLLYGWDLED